MKTVRETETFKRQADKIWSEEERLEFISYLASNPTVGDVIPKADKENMRPNEIKEVL